MFTHKNNEELSKDKNVKVNEIGGSGRVAVMAHGYRVSSGLMKVL